jgi:hypothetical protein
MEKEPEKEIMIEPGWSILEDGLGYQVMSLGGMPKIEKDGREVIVFTIRPDEKVRKRYNYKRGSDIDENGNMKISIDKNDLIPLNLYDDANRKWLYVKSFNHQPTNLSMREEELKKKITAKDKTILQQDAVIIRLNEVVLLAKTNPSKFMKEHMEILQETAKVFSELSSKKRED